MGNEFTKLAARHTRAYSVVVGLVLAAVLALKGVPFAGSLAAGAVFAFVTCLMWRRGGWARRRTTVPEGPVDKSKVTATLAFAIVVFAVVVAMAWATNR